MFNLFSNESYTLVLLVDNKSVVSKTCPTLQAAKDAMYRIMYKRGLSLKKAYNDYQAKTYICHGNAEFHINRAQKDCCGLKNIFEKYEKFSLTKWKL